MGASAGIQAVESERRQSGVASQEIWALCIIGVATLGGLAFRWLDLQKWSLWWDEGFTEWASALPLGRIIPFAKSDNQAPLYYLMQHFWGLLFGNSEFALRALSALFGTLALPVFYLLAKKVLKDGMAAALAFWLFAFSLRQIWYSREARAYEAASFFALVALCALVLFLEKRSAWAFVTIVLSSALTLYLHNMMFFYLFALDIVWLIYPSERAWTRRAREMLLANLCMALLYLPWAASLLTQINAVAGNLYWVPRPTLWDVAATLRDTAGLHVPNHLVLFAKKFLPLPGRVLEDGWAAALLVLCAALLAGGFWRVSKTERRKNFCFLLYCLLPVLLVFILGQRMPLYLERVFTTSSIAVPIIFAFPFAAQRGPRGKPLYAALGIALAGVAAVSSLGFVRSGEGLVRNGEDWRAVIATVLTIPGTNRLVLFVPPAGEIFFDYYAPYFSEPDTRPARTGLQEGFHDRFPPPKSRIITEHDIDHLRMVLESHKYSEIDLVLTHDVDPHGLIVNYLDRHFMRREDVPSGPRIQIIAFSALPQS